LRGQRDGITLWVMEDEVKGARRGNDSHGGDEVATAFV